MKYSYILILAFSSMLFVLGVGCEDGNPSGPEAKEVEVKIASDYTGRELHPGDTLLVEWTADPNPETGFNVYVSMDSGASFEVVNADVLSSDTRELSWEIPESAGGKNVKFKVEAVSGDDKFVVTSEELAVLEPLQDITVKIVGAIDNPWYYEGDTLHLEWNASADPAEGFEVLLSTDTGTTFSVISEDLLPPDTRSYKYAVTDAAAPRALLKVRAVNGTELAEAVSDTLTQNMNIRITTNLAGKVFSHDDDIRVEWVADTTRVTNGFLVEISWNMGVDYRSAIMAESLNMDETSTRVLFRIDDNGEPIDSDQCILRVHEYDYKQNKDLTGPFILRP